MSDSEDSTVIYMAVSSPFENGSDIGSPRVDGPPIMPEDPYAYIMATYQYMPQEDEILLTEEQPLPAAASPTADSSGYVPESDPEEEPKGDDEDPEEDPTDYPADRDDDDDDEEELYIRIFRLVEEYHSSQLNVFCSHWDDMGQQIHLVSLRTLLSSERISHGFFDVLWFGSTHRCPRVTIGLSAACTAEEDFDNNWEFPLSIH
ncbi:hypothetical protein Tco_1370761 [Tanacetum coccineum]